MVTKVRGRFDQVRGSIVAASDPRESSVDIAVDLASVNTANATRDEHLRSPDFLAVDQFPEMAYRASGVRLDGDRFALDGELTLKGITRPVELGFRFNGVAADPWGGTRAGFSALGSLSRKEFDVKFDGMHDGVAIVADRIDLHIEVEAVLRQPEGD
jgi:polyisoprenoid-binding protein YceI